MKEIIRMTDISTDTDIHANLHHFFLTIFAGEIHYLAGLHDSGKTAVRKVLCGQLPVLSGTMSVNGNPISSWSPYRARLEGIVSIEPSVSMVPSLSVYENIELFHFAGTKSKLCFFNKAVALQHTRELIEEYGLSIDPAMKVQDISTEDAFLLYLLAAAYSNARLIIINLSNLKLSYMNDHRFFQILKQLNAKGIAFLLLCDFFRAPLLPGKIDLIRKGYIVREYDSLSTDAAHVNSLLLYGNTSPFHQTASDTCPPVIGILELYYSNYSLPEYFFGLGLVPESGSHSDTTIKFLKADSLTCLNDNLSIGDNIAMVQYPSIAEKTGYIDASVLNYLEKEFYATVSQFITLPAKSMEHLSSVEKKILSIERWIMAGTQKLIIEDPLWGLDAEGQQIESVK